MSSVCVYVNWCWGAVCVYVLSAADIYNDSVRISGTRGVRICPRVISSACVYVVRTVCAYVLRECEIDMSILHVQNQEKLRGNVKYQCCT